MKAASIIFVISAVCSVNGTWNDGVETESKRFLMSQNVPAEVSVIPEKVEVVPGRTNIAIDCNAAGDQPLTVEWFKDGTKLSGNGHVFILPGDILLVNQATAVDLGEYTCLASNALGTAFASSLGT